MDAGIAWREYVGAGGADPADVTAVQNAGHQEVWFTESGADRIGRLSYTDTTTYASREYTLMAGSRPLNLVSGGGFIWFTEMKANQTEGSTAKSTY